MVYTAPGSRLGKVPVELLARRVTKAVLVSTLPVGPLLNVALPSEGDSSAQMTSTGRLSGALEEPGQAGVEPPEAIDAVP